MKIIEKKCWPDRFDEIRSGKRTADVRKDDSDYQDGDTLLLREFDATLDQYFGSWVRVTITRVTRNVEGLVPGWCRVVAAVVAGFVLVRCALCRNAIRLFAELLSTICRKINNKILQKRFTIGSLSVFLRESTWSAP